MLYRVNKSGVLCQEPLRRWSRLKSWRTTGEGSRERFNLSNEDRPAAVEARAVDVASGSAGTEREREKENRAPFFHSLRRIVSSGSR